MISTGRILSAIVILLMAAGLMAEDGGYKTYERTKSENLLLKISITKDEWTIMSYLDDEEDVTVIAAPDVRQSGGRVLCGDDIVIDADGITVGDTYLAADRIRTIEVEADMSAPATTLSFIESRTGERESSFRRKMQDRISFGGTVVVDEEDFIRGSIVSYFGDIEVKGEVNEDVVAVFGDIRISEDAVVRGDVIAVTGKIRLDPGASVYGLVKSGKGKSSLRRSRARRWKYGGDFEINADGEAGYNRVDGLSFMTGFSYDDPDSVIPSFSAVGGYAFGSDRWRFRLGITQTVLRGAVPVQAGGRYYRLLKSDDERLIGDLENSLYAFCFNEDWKDYYEAQGGYAFIRTRVLGWNTLEIGYLAEKQRWFDAHPLLWSLFGGKEFRGNFSSMPYPVRMARMDDFDDKTVTSFIIDYKIDTRDDNKHPRQGWYGYARYEYSPDRWKGDFDFERFEARVRRYQPLGRYVSIYLTGAYGYAEGDYLPLNRYFFLGGLGTLHGYRHKEFMGTEYVMVSGEYNFRIPHSDISPFLAYDGGRIAAGRLSSGDSWYSSLGIGVDIDRSLRLLMSKRLDRDDEDPVFYARFSLATF